MTHGDDGPGSPVRIFGALANADRLALVHALSEGRARHGDDRGMSITELARRTELSRFSASRHLAVLRDARIVTATVTGHATLHALDLRGLEELDDWLCPLLELITAAG